MAEFVKRDAYLVNVRTFSEIRMTLHERQGIDAVAPGGLGHQQRRIFPFIPTIRILAFLFAHAIKSNSLSRNQVISYTGPA
jgi:hypothetical protein